MSISFDRYFDNNNIWMQVQEEFWRRKAGKKIRVKIKTNRNLDFITSIKHDATISDLAKRALSVYLQLAEDAVLQTAKKQLTVSAVKQGIFYMPKSEYVTNLLNHDDEVEVIIVKAKPKYPNQLINTRQSSTKNTVISKNKQALRNETAKQSQHQQLPPCNLPANNSVISDLPEDQMSVVKASKKQKIKDKRKQKFQKKRQKQDLLKSQTKPNNETMLKENTQSKPMPQEMPRKRLKFDKEQPIHMVDKSIIVPSPKITFHLQPKIQSPKVFLLESSKKKFPGQGQSRKQSEDLDKKNQIDKIISPLIAHRSPLIGQKTPNQSNCMENLKQKQKDELSGFLLPARKLSEDKRFQKKEEIKLQQQPKSPIKKAPQERSQGSNEKHGEQLKNSKQTKNFIVVQQVDSESEQNKKTNETSLVHHRQKEITEIYQKINNFRFDSEQDQK